LGKLNEKKYWKKMLLPFKYESPMNGFNDIVEDLSSYYSDIQLSIGFILDVPDILHDLHLELAKFYHKLKDARVFTTEREILSAL
jgi:hypothetical protein